MLVCNYYELLQQILKNVQFTAVEDPLSLRLNI